MKFLYLLMFFSFATYVYSTEQTAEKPDLKTEDIQMQKKQDDNKDTDFDLSFDIYDKVKKETTTNASYESVLFKTIFSLLAIVILMILTVWVFKRFSHGRLKQINSLKMIKILEKRPISPKSMLYLLEVGNEKILISESQIEVNKISKLNLKEHNPHEPTEINLH